MMRDDTAWKVLLWSLAGFVIGAAALLVGAVFWLWFRFVV